MFTAIEPPITPPRDRRAEAIDHELDRLDDNDIAQALGESSNIDLMAVAFVELANCKDILQDTLDGRDPLGGRFGERNKTLLRALLGSARMALRETESIALKLAEKRVDEAESECAA